MNSYPIGSGELKQRVLDASLVVYTPGIIKSLNGPAHISSECDVFVVFLSGDEEDRKMLRAAEVGGEVQGSAKRLSPGCVNAAGKARQKC